MAPVQGIAQREHHFAGGHGPGSALAGARFPVVAAVQQKDLGDGSLRNLLPYPLRCTHAMLDMASWHRAELSHWPPKT